MSNVVCCIRPFALPLLVLMVACGDSTSVEQPPPIASRIAIQSGDNQAAEAGSLLSAQLSVLVTDASGQPVEGAEIVWSLESESTATITVTSSTNSQGVSSLGRTLGNEAGPYFTRASLKALPSANVRFTSFAQIQGAYQITMPASESGHQQSDTVLSTLRPYRVRVLDYRDRPVVGVAVDWLVVTGDGLLSSRRTSSDVNGIAEVTHTIGRFVGTVNVEASVSGLIGTPIRFLGTARAGRLVGLAPTGSDQLGAVNSQLPLAYRVVPFDSHGNFAQSTMRWTVTSGGGTLVLPPSGDAYHTLGPNEGPQTVTVSAFRGADTVSSTFTSTAVGALVVVAPGESDYYYYYYSSNTFYPDSVVVTAGASVAWQWLGCAGCEPHNVTFEDAPTEPASSGNKNFGTHTRVFTGPPRTIRYRCTNHSSDFTTGMVGTVHVK